MAAEYSRKRILDRIWSRLADPRTMALALLALGLVEALRHWHPSDGVMLLARVCAVIALCTGFVSTVEMIRPRRRAMTRMVSRQIASAWSFPFFKSEYEPSLLERGWRWRTVVVAYAVCSLAIPAVILMSSVQYQPAGVLMLVPGQEGQEAYHETYPEDGLQRTLGVKLQLLHATVDRGVPMARLRATDMQTMATSDIVLHASTVARVRDVLLSIRELRPLNGLGGARLKVALNADTDEATKDETVTLYPGGSADLSDGTTLYWDESDANRFQTLGAAFRIHRERDGKIIGERWVYVDFPWLNTRHADGAPSFDIVHVERPVGALFSVRAIGGPAWGYTGVAILILSMLLLVLLRFLPAQRVGRDGDYVVLGPIDGRDAVVGHVRSGSLGDSDADKWIVSVDEEDGA